MLRIELEKFGYFNENHYTMHSEINENHKDASCHNILFQAKYNEHIFHTFQIN